MPIFDAKQRRMTPEKIDACISNTLLFCKDHFSSLLFATGGGFYGISRMAHGIVQESTLWIGFFVIVISAIMKVMDFNEKYLPRITNFLKKK